MIASFLEQLYQGSFEGDEQAMLVLFAIYRLNFITSDLSETWSVTWSSTFFNSQFVGDLVEIDVADRRFLQHKSCRPGHRP